MELEQSATRAAFDAHSDEFIANVDGTETEIRAILDRGIERWNSVTGVMTRQDELSVLVADGIPPRSSYIYQYYGQLYRVGEIVEDDGYLATVQLFPVQSNKQNTLDASLEFSL